MCMLGDSRVSQAWTPGPRQGSWQRPTGSQPRQGGAGNQVTGQSLPGDGCWWVTLPISFCTKVVTSSASRSACSRSASECFWCFLLILFKVIDIIL